jgi:hypothetical protein
MTEVQNNLNINMDNNEDNNILIDNNNSFQQTQFSLNEEDEESESLKRQRIESSNTVSPLRPIYTQPTTINTNQNNSFNPEIPMGLDDWIYNRIRKILNIQNSLNEKKKVLKNLHDHMSAGTFPIDLPTNRFKGYGLYPHSITEEERKAIIEQEKEIMRKACKALLEIRLQVLEKDCLHLDKEVLEPLKKYEETLKDASIPFPIIKEHNHPLQKYIIDAISNGILNPPAYSRSGTPRSRTSSISRRRTPPTHCCSCCTNSSAAFATAVNYCYDTGNKLNYS